MLQIIHPPVRDLDATAASDAESSNDKENLRQPPNHDQQQPSSSTYDADDASAIKPDSSTSSSNDISSASTTIVSRTTLSKEMSKQVLRHKLQKLRHLVIEEAIAPAYLDSIFPQLLQLFDPQTVTYNGGVAKIKKWKISCYLEVMEGGVPCTNPNLELRQVFLPLLDTCNALFLEWYRQQHACNKNNNDNTVSATKKQKTCRRLMTFITRYTPNPGEQALLKHVDGAGKVDGSVVVALPIDRWSAPKEENSFEGHGGGITFWDGKEAVPPTADAQQQQQQQQCQRYRPREIHYETRSGDIAFIDRAVWHQADPITKGTRWALVIFYKVMEEQQSGRGRMNEPNHEGSIKSNP